MGLDQAAAVQNTGATLQFMVFTQVPSGPIPPPVAAVPVNLNQVGMNTTCTITDLWTGRVVGKFSGEFAPKIRRQRAGLYKITVNRKG